MSQADYDMIEAHKAEIYAMPFKGTWSVEGVTDVCLEIREHAEDSIRILGEQVAPVLR